MTIEIEDMDQLIDLAEGRLAETDARPLLTRVDADAELTEVHAWLKEFMALASRTTLVSPPPATRARLEGLLPQRRFVSDALDRVADYVGRLVSDGRTGPVVAGARGAAVDARRQLLFDIGGDVELVVDLELLTDAVVVTGQVLGEDPARSVRLVGEDSPVEVATDDLGEFTARLPATSFLHIELRAGQQMTAVDLTPYLDQPSRPPEAPLPHQENR